MTRQDDRTPEQQITHPCLVVGTDSFLSGWGEAQDGASYAAWACPEEDWSTVERWVRQRGDMRRVRQAVDTPRSPYRPGRRCAHLHIYVAANNCGARQDGVALHGEVTLAPWTHPADAQEEVAQ